MDTTAEEMADHLNACHVDLTDLDACCIALSDFGFPTHLITVFVDEAIDLAHGLREGEDIDA